MFFSQVNNKVIFFCSIKHHPAVILLFTLATIALFHLSVLAKLNTIYMDHTFQIFRLIQMTILKKVMAVLMKLTCAMHFDDRWSLWVFFHSINCNMHGITVVNKFYQHR